MLPQANRLKRRRDFEQVYKRGTWVRSRYLHLCVLKQVQDPVQSIHHCHSPPLTQPSRIGFSISLKVHKRAVVRNRIKRQLRAVCRVFLPQLAFGWDLVIVVRPGAVQCDYFEFLQELEQLLTRAEVLNGHS